MTATTLTLADFLLARIAEDEAAARAAIDRDRPGTHWHWVMDHNDVPVAAGHLQGAQDDGESVSLRTVEEYPTKSGVGPLPHFVVQSGDVHGGGGEHIARHDPARVLAECDAKRRIMAIDYRADDSGEATLIRDDVLKALALPYADHPDYNEAWRP